MTADQMDIDGVYLIHFERPYRHAAHYVGWSTNIATRFDEHNRGEGARLTQVVRDAGIGLTLARVWPKQSRRFERVLKRRHGSARFCPVCATKRKEARSE